MGRLSGKSWCFLLAGGRARRESDEVDREAEFLVEIKRLGEITAYPV